jgi:hypothetical protein
MYLLAAEKQTLVKPFHPHDCDACRLIGVRVSTHDDLGTERQRDIYYCEQGCNVRTIVSRYGPDGEYSSGWPTAGDFGMNGDADGIWAAWIVLGGNKVAL